MLKWILAGVLLQAGLAQAEGFALTSPGLQPGHRVPEKFVANGFGCTGENISPALNWVNPPAGTKSFAITVHDPDAPTGGAGFWHWVVVNLPATMTGLAEGDGVLNSTHLPAGAQQIRNDFGMPAWGGPCPPAGDKPHRYNFTVYALKVGHLDVPAGASAAAVGRLIDRSSIASAGFTVRYGR